MAKLVGGALRLFATFFYFLDFLCAACILGIYSYFLAKLNYHNQNISNQLRAVEGLSGAAVLYTIFAVILTCFLGGISFFAFLAVFLDLLFMGAMIAIAVLVRGAAHTCNGPTTTTPVGNGSINSYGVADMNLGVACKLNLTVLIVACAGALFFLISAFLQYLVSRHHKKEQKYGPSPANDYTSGSGKRKFYQRKPKTTREAYATTDVAEMGTVPAPTGALVTDRPDMRPSHDTAMTGTTMAPIEPYTNGNKYEAPVTKYETPAPIPAVPALTTTAVRESAFTGPNVVSSVSETREGHYDPYYRGTTTGGTGYATGQNEYNYQSGRPVDSSTNY